MTKKYSNTLSDPKPDEFQQGGFTPRRFSQFHFLDFNYFLLVWFCKWSSMGIENVLEIVTKILQEPRYFHVGHLLNIMQGHKYSQFDAMVLVKTKKV